MNTNRNTIIGAGLALLLLIAFSWFMVRDNKKDNATESALTSSNVGDLATLAREGKVVVESAAQNVSAPAPSLERESPVTPGLDSTVVVRLQGEIKEFAANLKKTPTSFQDWIDLGLAYKQLGDYEGAKGAWEYVSLLYPENIVSFGNLGDLYANFLKDYAKAEARYRTAIKNKPNDVYLYGNLFDLYKVYKQGAGNGEAVLKDGIAKNSNELSLPIMLARYYRDAGRAEEAKSAYDAVIALAVREGNTAVADSLTAEKSAL